MKEIKDTVVDNLVEMCRSTANQFIRPDYKENDRIVFFDFINTSI